MMTTGPLKEAELRKCSVCACCKKKLGQTGSPLFYRVMVQGHFLNLGAISRQQGLGMALGGSGLLAMVMGCDEDMTIPTGEPVTMTVCQNCATESHWPLAAIMESAEAMVEKEVTALG